MGAGVIGFPAATSSGSGVMTLLGSAAVAGAAATTMTVSGLNLSAYGAFKIFGKLKNATASNMGVGMYLNADTTDTNYYHVLLTYVSTATVQNGNTARIAFINASENGTVEITMQRDVDGYPRSYAVGLMDSTATFRTRNYSHYRNNTDNVTSIALTAETASGLAIGSTMKVYGIA